MATKKSMWVLFGILVVSAWVLGSVKQAQAETLNFKAYNYSVKAEIIPVGDVEGHNLSLGIRRAFNVFENGEVATSIIIVSSDMIKGSGSNIQYNTMTFADGSTIVARRAGTVGGTAEKAITTSDAEGQIIKGTGRFQGIKGTLTTKGKFLPLEKGEVGQKYVGEGTITYTLPPK